MLAGVQLANTLKTIPTRWLRDTYIRATPAAHAADPLGRLRPIGKHRFNRRNGARVLYLAQDMQTSVVDGPVVQLHRTGDS